MSSFLSELGGITAGVGAEGLAFAAGFAASHALTPEATLIGQDSWHAAQTRRINAELAAAIAAEDIAAYDVLRDEATYSGVDESRFAYLYHFNLTAPGMGELLTMLRRKTINPGNFTHGLRKNKLEPMWDDALADLANQKISATDLAYMIVRGVLPDEGLLPGNLPTQAEKLQLPPQLPLNPVTEAQKTGWDQERLAAMVARSGLAMAPGMAAQANFRGILTDNDYLLTIARGDLFPAYADPVLEVSRAIPTPVDYAEAWLRGYRTQQEAEDGAGLHGMKPGHLDLLHLIRGRPVPVHQVVTGLARGGVYPSLYTDVPEPYRDAIRESDIKEPWASIAYHNRFTYPSAFVLRNLAQSGDLGGQAEVEQVLLEIGWKPSFAKQVSTAWTGGATVADKHVTKAETSLWTTTHKSYVAHEITDADATTALGAAGVSAAVVPAVLNLWQAERNLIRKQLSPAQVRKAVNGAVTNPATGQPWSHADGIAALLARGYDQADAETFLAE